MQKACRMAGNPVVTTLGSPSLTSVADPDSRFRETLNIAPSRTRKQKQPAGAVF
jgi:hypothetical protein